MRDDSKPRERRAFIAIGFRVADRGMGLLFSLLGSMFKDDGLKFENGKIKERNGM